MKTIDITSIILAVITLLGGCGWVIDRKILMALIVLIIILRFRR